MAVQPIVLEPDTDPASDVDFVLVNQDPKSGKVTVSGNVQTDTKQAKFLPTQTFWTKDAAADEDRGMEFAEQWAAQNGVQTIYIRRSQRDA